MGQSQAINADGTFTPAGGIVAAIFAEPDSCG